MDGEPESGSLEELLQARGIDEEEPRVAPAQPDHRVMRSTLWRGFAQTRSVEAQLDDVFKGLHRVPAMPSWQEELQKQELMARLRPAGRHQGSSSNTRGVVFDIPVADHPLVDAWVDYFTGRGRIHFERYLARAERYRPIMEPILLEHGLPRDTIYLAMIESGFNAQAYSVAAASGFWQFIQSTGRLYSLRSDNWVDERRDFVMATHSAARFLKDLYNEFGDWHLAWAGYNAGGGRIRRAIKRFETQNFFELIAHRGSLAEETRNYVPKIIAAAIVSKNRERYGFEQIEGLETLQWDELRVASATDLRVVARKLNVDLETLRVLNPALRHDITPPGREFHIRVPAGRGAEVSGWLAELPPSKRLNYKQYVVKSGDSLHRIAARYGASMQMVRELNRIHNPHLLRPGQMLIIPTLKGGSQLVATVQRKTRNWSAKASAAKEEARARHRVANGDTLWSIAQRYGTTVEHLKRWNRRRTNRIGVGEVLYIF